MKRFITASALSAAILLGAFAVSYAAEYSADMHTVAQGQTVDAKISVKDNKSRTEMSGMSIINRGDLGVSWIVVPVQGMYMEHPFDARTLAQTSGDAAGVQREALGQETVDGESLDKFKVTYTVRGKSESLYQWLNAQGQPVKCEALDQSWTTTFSNIRTSGVEDSLFEVPAGLQKMQMPSMGDMGAGADSNTER